MKLNQVTAIPVERKYLQQTYKQLRKRAYTCVNTCLRAHVLLDKYMHMLLVDKSDLSQLQIKIQEKQFRSYAGTYLEQF